ncbi:MAG: hypothetical protein IJ649_00940, partial [Oscillospiraceae bacterium]|nr:hypothetical protein [Oscillospiraceae bacterium]
LFSLFVSAVRLPLSHGSARLFFVQVFVVFGFVGEQQIPSVDQTKKPLRCIIPFHPAGLLFCFLSEFYHPACPKNFPLADKAKSSAITEQALLQDMK